MMTGISIFRSLNSPCKGSSTTGYIETWFVECKHYKQGVPPDKIQGALSWANAERPDKLLIIVSNFLSNATKDNLKGYVGNNRPAFKISYWEKPALEKLTTGKISLMRKYRISGDFSWINIMHPAHLLYITSFPGNTLRFFFEQTDKLDERIRDDVLSPAYYMLHGPRTPMDTTPIAPYTYDSLKSTCYSIVQTNIISEFQIMYLVIHFILHMSFEEGNYILTNQSIAEIKKNNKQLESEINQYPERRQDNEQIIKDSEQTMLDMSKKVQEKYANYVYFCEHVVEQLLVENYL